jgi:uracil-DNA glycosylase family 4
MIEELAMAAREIDRRKIALERHQARIRECVDCVQAGYIPSAMPIFQGHAAQRIMIIGQAPAYRKVERPPYSGASGKKLDAWLEQAGFPPGSLQERCYLTSITKCFPGPGKNGNGDRAPSASEIALCRPLLDGELSLVQPEVIITLGTLAAAKFLKRRPLAELVGRSWEHDGRVILPLPHPSGVSRWLNDPAHQTLVDTALDELSWIRQELNL